MTKGKKREMMKNHIKKYFLITPTVLILISGYSMIISLFIFLSNIFFGKGQEIISIIISVFFIIFAFLSFFYPEKLSAPLCLCACLVGIIYCLIVTNIFLSLFCLFSLLVCLLAMYKDVKIDIILKTMVDKRLLDLDKKEKR